MANRPKWEQQFQEEINLAKKARASGNEGMARVCARRAAGIVAGEFLQNHYHIDLGPNAIDQLRYLASNPEVPDIIRSTAEHFLVRVLPDHSFPIDADLIADAYWLKDKLHISGDN